MVDEQVMTEMHDNNVDEVIILDLVERLTVRNEKAFIQPFTYGKKENSIILHPQHSAHLNHLKNVTFTKKFFGEKLTNHWIKAALEKDVEFDVQCLRLISCGITLDELAAVCQDNKIDIVFLHQCTALNLFQMGDIAPWFKFATKIWIDIKNMTFENDWLSNFMDRGNDDNGMKIKIKRFMVQNVPFRTMNLIHLEEFLKTVDSSMDSVLTISFAKTVSIKTIKKLIARAFNRVSKEQFNTFESTKKFVVQLNPGKKNYKYYYYVSKAALNEPQHELDIALEHFHV